MLWTENSEWDVVIVDLVLSKNCGNFNKYLTPWSNALEVYLFRVDAFAEFDEKLPTYTN